MIQLIEFKDQLLAICDKCEEALRNGNVLRDPVLSREVIDYIEDRLVIERVLHMIEARMCARTAADILERLIKVKILVIQEETSRKDLC